MHPAKWTEYIAVLVVDKIACVGKHLRKSKKCPLDAFFDKPDDGREFIILAQSSTISSPISSRAYSSIVVTTKMMIPTKVETPIHDSIRELVTWGVQRAWSEIMNVLADPKGSARRWNLEFLEAWAILHNFFEARVL